MTGYMFFIVCFFILGVYCIIYSILKLRKLNSEDKDYLKKRKQYTKSIWGGLGYILVGVWIYLTKIVWNLWQH